MTTTSRLQLLRGFRCRPISSFGIALALCFAPSAFAAVTVMETAHLEPASPLEEFGRSLATDGQTLVAGSHEALAGRGQVLIYQRNGEEWIEVQSLEGLATGDHFGFAADIDGDVLAIAAPAQDRIGLSSGVVHIYERNGATWSISQSLTATSPVDAFYFGLRIDLEDNRLLIGSSLGQQAFLFERASDQAPWTQVHLFEAPPGAPSGFGAGVALSGDTVALGAPFSSSPSAHRVYVFERDLGAGWGQAAELAPAPAIFSGDFGDVLALEGNDLVIGYRQACRVQIHHRGTGNWASIKNLEGPFLSDFGYRIALDGNTLLVATRLDDNVHVLERNLGGFGNWGTSHILSNPIGSEWSLGGFVAVSGTTFAAQATDFINGEDIGSIFLYEQEATPTEDGFFDADPINDVPSGGQPITPVAERAGLGFGDLPPGDVDFYAVDLMAGDFFTADATPLGGSFQDPALRVGFFAPDGTLLLSQEGTGGNDLADPEIPQTGGTMLWNAEVTGRHFLAVTHAVDLDFTGNHTLSGRYLLTADRHPAIAVFPETADNDQLENATPLPIPAGGARQIQAVLDESNGDVDYFSSAMTADAVLTLLVTPRYSDFVVPDVVAGVFDAAGTLIVENSEARSNPAFTGAGLVRFRVPADGVYPFAVADWEDDFMGRGNDSTGEYLISASLAEPALTPALDTEPQNDARAGADPVIPSADGSFLARAELATGGLNDVDYFSLQLAAGEVLTAVTTPLSADLQDPDTRLTLLDAAGTPLQTNGDAGTDHSPAANETDGRGSILLFQPTIAGTYFLAVGAEDDMNLDGSGGAVSGAYALSVTVHPADLPLGTDTELGFVNDCISGTNFLGLDCAPDAISVDVGRAESFLGGLGSYDVDFFEIELQANTVISALAASVYNAQPDSKLGIFDANGNLLTQDDECCDGFSSPVLRYEVPIDGTYFLGIAEWDDEDYDNDGAGDSSSGPYWLTVAVADPTQPIIRPSLGVEVTDSPPILLPPGGDVTTGIQVRHLADAPESITVDSLMDSELGDLGGVGDCSVPFTLAAGDSFDCSIQRTITGVAGDDQIFTITAQGIDAGGFAVSEETSTTVSIAGGITDFGDAPAPYPTLRADNGAVHLIGDGHIRMGNSGDDEADGQPSPDAQGDDQDGNDDETGIEFFSELIQGRSAEINLFSLSIAIIDAWFDWNQDGDWDDEGEHLLDHFDYAVPFQPRRVAIDIPITAMPGTTFARFRVTSTGIDSPTGLALDGEVEDYQVTITPAAAMDITYTAIPAALSEAGGLVNYQLRVTRTGGESLFLTSIVDDRHGNLVDLGCSLVLVNTSTYTCGFQAPEAANAGTVLSSTVTVSASSSGSGLPVTEQATAQVSFTDLLPPLSVNVTPTPSSIDEPSGPVSFSVQVSNGGVAQDPVVLQSLSDDTLGSLAGVGDCALPQTLASGGSYSCSYSDTVLGNGGEVATRQIAASGQDDDGNTVSATASASVNVADIAPAITATLDATPSSVSEPGGDVDLTATISNSTAETVTLESLDDDVLGAVDGLGTCALPQTIAGHGSYACTYAITLIGNAGDSESRGISATVRDDEAQIASAQATTTITVIGVDWGDALGSAFPTLAADDGARHSIVAGFHLGAQIDAEANGQPTSSALGDDNTPSQAGGADDEDGLVVDGFITPGLSASMQITASAPGLLDAWVDWNGDGEWSEPQERLFSARNLIAGVNSLSFPVPTDAAAGMEVSARLRFSSAGIDTPFGLAADGEVEDHRLTIEQPEIEAERIPAQSTVPEPGSGVAFSAIVRNVGSAPVLLQALTDSEYGDLDGQGSCSLPQTVATHADYSCSFTAQVLGNAGAVLTGTLTAAATSAGASLSAQATSSVTVSDVAPSLTASLNAEQIVIPEPGADVDFTARITNTSVETVTLETLSDQALGSLNGLGSCVLPQTLAPSAIYACTYTATITGNAGDTINRVIDATVRDDEAGTASAQAGATLAIIGVDWGDAPDPAFPTLATSDGARHGIMPGFHLGSTIDSETDGQPEASALGDDQSPSSPPSVDDEDGVVFAGFLTPGLATTLEVTASAAGLLDAWIDWNADGEWTEPEERLFTAESLDAGLNSLVVSVPAGVAAGNQVVARFRFSSAGIDSTSGFAADGEVEDHLAMIENPQISINRTPATTTVPEPGTPVSFTIQASNTGTAPAILSALADSVFGDLNGQGDCLLPQTLAPAGSYSCTFAGPVLGDAGFAQIGTLDAAATSAGASINAQATSTVTVIDSAPSLAVSHTPSSASVIEPGAVVTYIVSVTNSSVATDPVTLSSLLDDQAGDLNGQGDCALPQSLAAGATYTCSYDRALLGRAGDVDNAQVTASAADDETTATQQNATATVTFTGVDWGDAPDPGFPTSSASDGARHTIVAGFFLGTTIDAEADGQPQSSAAGDDSTPSLPGGSDDEDGVMVTGFITPGLDATLEVTASAVGLLDAWVDWNGDGQWSGTLERLFSAENLAAGVNSLIIAVPSEAAAGSQIVARFRFSSAGIDSPSGLAADGEVEDHLLTLERPEITASRVPAVATLPEPGASISFAAQITNTGTADAALTTLTDSVFGDLEGQGDCALPQSLAPNASYSCVFTGNVLGNAGFTQIGTLEATASSAGAEISTQASSSVILTDVAPSITASLDAAVTSVPEPGGDLDFRVRIINTSVEAVTLETLSDSILGSLNGVGDCSLPQTLAVDASYSCLYATTIQANAGDTATPTLNASARDDEAQSVGAQANETVGITNSAPSIVLTHTPSTATVNEPGETVSYSISVSNTSVTTDPITLSTLVDDQVGDLNAQGDCVLPQTLAPGTSYTCSYDRALSGRAGDVDIAELTATAEDDEASVISESAIATVTFIGVDWGDAPDPSFPTLAASGGARHIIVAGFHLGASIDAEADGQPDPLALGDDATASLPGGGDDEDGVVLPNTLAPDALAEIEITASAAGRLDAWIDFAGDGSWNQPGDRIFDNEPLTAGLNSLQFMVANELADITLARFRFSSAGSLAPDGPAADGEVEDYRFINDIDPPELLTGTPRLIDGPALEDCLTTRQTWRRFIVEVSEPVSEFSAADFRLLAPGPDHQLDTESCQGAPVGGDIEIDLEIASNTDRMAEIRTLQEPPSGLLRLLVCDSLTDLATNPLDGDGDGIAGGHFQASFRYDPDNLLGNGHFDCNLEAWATAPGAAPPALWIPIDAQDSDHSGSAFLGVSDSGTSVRQCLEATARTYFLNATIRVDALEGTVVAARRSCRFFDGPTCSGQPIGDRYEDSLVVDTAGDFIALEATFTAPNSTLSASCGIDAIDIEGLGVSYVDQLELRDDSVVFSDGFESGNTSLWSSP